MAGDKRPAPEVEDEITPEEFASMSRSERKRHREKKRRSEVNKGCEDLLSLLLLIDPNLRAEAEERKHCKGSKSAAIVGDGDASVLNRVDLISKTVTVLERLHRENEENKRRLEELSRSGGVSGVGGAPMGHRTRGLDGADRVAMLVPYLTPSDSLITSAMMTGAANSMAQRHHSRSTPARGAFQGSALDGYSSTGTQNAPSVHYHHFPSSFNLGRQQQQQHNLRPGMSRGQLESSIGGYSPELTMANQLYMRNMQGHHDGNLRSKSNTPE